VLLFVVKNDLHVAHFFLKGTKKRDFIEKKYDFLFSLSTKLFGN